MHTAYIALGSNLKNPLMQVERARATLEASDKVKVLKASSWYSSSPVGGKPQPHYINGVLKIQTRLSPHNLLRYLLGIEVRQGRVRVAHEKNAPRSIDIDILLYEDKSINSASLTLPHPRMTKRNFVLLPLLEIEPHTQLPHGQNISDCISANKRNRQDCKRLEPALDPAQARAAS